MCGGGGLRCSTPSPRHTWFHPPFELSGCNQRTRRALWLGCGITLTSVGSLAWRLTGPSAPLGSWIIQSHEVVEGVVSKAWTRSIRRALKCRQCWKKKHTWWSLSNFMFSCCFDIPADCSPCFAPVYPVVEDIENGSFAVWNLWALTEYNAKSQWVSQH